MAKNQLGLSLGSATDKIKSLEDYKNGLDPADDPTWVRKGRMLNADTYRRTRNKRLRRIIEAKDRETMINNAQQDIHDHVTFPDNRFSIG